MPRQCASVQPLGIAPADGNRVIAVTVREEARDAASEVYIAAWKRLKEEADELERTGRPLMAQIRHRQAILAHRAALAEETDEEPRRG